MGQKARELYRPTSINADLPDEYIPPDQYTNGENIIFRNARLNRAGGLESVWQDVNPFGFAPIHLLYAPYQGTGYWIMCTEDKVQLTDGVTHTGITPAGGLQAVGYNEWTSAELNGLPVLNNGRDAPIYWDGNTANPCAPLPDFPASTVCYSLRPFKFHLIAMNIDGPGGLDDTLLLWSDAAAPGQVPQSWTAATDSEAGNNVLGDETGPIIDGLALREDFIIYKQRSVYVMAYVGGLEVMSFRKLFTNRGIFSRNCVAEHQGFHYVLGDGDLYVHDGQTMKSIADNRIRETLFALIDPVHYLNSYVVVNKDQNEVYFCVPSGGLPEPRTAVVYDIDTDSWGLRDIPSCTHAASGIVNVAAIPPTVLEWDDASDPWLSYNRRWNESSQTLGTVNDGVLFAQPSGYNGPNVLFLDADVLSNGLTVDARIDWLTKDLGTPGVVKLVRKVWPRFSNVASGDEFTIKVGGQIELGDAIAFQEYTFTIGESNSVDVTVPGKFISIQIESAIDRVWTLTGFGIEYETLGGY